MYNSELFVSLKRAFKNNVCIYMYKDSIYTSYDEYCRQNLNRDVLIGVICWPDDVCFLTSLPYCPLLPNIVTSSHDYFCVK